MYLGLAQVALGFVFLVIAVFEMQAIGDMKSSMIWLVLAYLFHTTGELCISPIGLSMVTKLAPLRLASLMMGVWFLVNFVRQHARRLHRRVHREHGPVRLDGAHSRPTSACARSTPACSASSAGWRSFCSRSASPCGRISGRVVHWMHGAEKITR